MHRLGKAAYITMSLILTSALFAGCGGKDEQLTAQSEVQEEQQASTFVGKIKSIEDQTITVYKALDASSAGASTEADSSSEVSSEDISSEDISSEDISPEAETKPEADDSAGPTSMTGTGGNEPGPAGNETYQFSVEDTIEVTVTEETIITSLVSSANELTVDDLKAEDVVSIQLKEGTMEAATIEVIATFSLEGAELAPGNESAEGTEAPDGQEKDLTAPPQNADGKPADGQPQNGEAPAGGGGQTPEGGQPPQGEGNPPSADNQADKTSSQAASTSQGAVKDSQSSQANDAQATTDSGKAASPSTEAPANTGSAEMPQGQGNPDQSGGGTMGKIKSISGSQITVYAATAPPRETEAAGGEQPEPPAEGSATPENITSEETAVITVTSDTKLVSVAFSNNQMVESAISLSDLQEGAMIQYTLAENSTNALKITVSPAGGPGEMNGPGPGENTGQTTSTTE